MCVYFCFFDELSSPSGSGDCSAVDCCTVVTVTAPQNFVGPKESCCCLFVRSRGRWRFYCLVAITHPNSVFLW